MDEVSQQERSHAMLSSLRIMLAAVLLALPSAVRSQTNYDELMEVAWNAIMGDPTGEQTTFAIMQYVYEGRVRIPPNNATFQVIAGKAAGGKTPPTKGNCYEAGIQPGDFCFIPPDICGIVARWYLRCSDHDPCYKKVCEFIALSNIVHELTHMNQSGKLGQDDKALECGAYCAQKAFIEAMFVNNMNPCFASGCGRASLLKWLDHISLKAFLNCEGACP